MRFRTLFIRIPYQVSGYRHQVSLLLKPETCSLMPPPEG